MNRSSNICAPISPSDRNYLRHRSLFFIVLLCLENMSWHNGYLAEAAELSPKAAPAVVCKRKVNENATPAEKVELGEMLFFNGNPKAAIKAFNEAIDLDPNCFQAHFDLASIYQQTGNVQGAINEYREIARLHSKEREAFVNLGMLQRECGNLKEAIANFEIALSLPVKVPETDTENVLAFTLVSDQQPEKAMSHFDHLIQSGGKARQPDWILGKAMALFKLNKTSEALSEIDRALDSRPDYPAAHNLKGDVLYAVDRKDDAVNEYKKAIEEDPLFCQGYLSIGNFYLKDKQFVLARDIFQKGEKVKPDDKNILYGLAYALENCGDVKTAIEKYEAVLAMERDVNERLTIQTHLQELIAEQGNLLH